MGAGYFVCGDEEGQQGVHGGFFLDGWRQGECGEDGAGDVVLDAVDLLEEGFDGGRVFDEVDRIGCVFLVGVSRVEGWGLGDVRGILACTRF
jgi:hypothetical protein